MYLSHNYKTNLKVKSTTIMMKKTTLLFAICALLIGTSNNADAQKYKGESVVTLGAGYSFVGALFDAVSTDATAAPAILVMYDYAIGDKFTLGAAFSYQSMGYSFDNTYYSTANVPMTEVVEFKYARMNFGIRPLFHFGNNDDMDWYTGLRIGYQTWAVSNDSNDPFYIDGDEAIEVLSRPTVQPLLGARYFFTENIGVNLEVGLGSPYVAMVGANFRF